MVIGSASVEVVPAVVVGASLVVAAEVAVVSLVSAESPTPPLVQATATVVEKRRTLATARLEAARAKRPASPAVWKSKFYDAFVLNHRVDLHAIDATPARWRVRCRFLAARPSQVGHVIAEK